VRVSALNVKSLFFFLLSNFIVDRLTVAVNKNKLRKTNKVQSKSSHN